MNKILITIYAFFVSYYSSAQTAELITALPKSLSGCSGIEMAPNGDLVMINDHGRPVVYFFDTVTYSVKKTIHLNNRIQDWEDLTIDENANLYIGDFGNNHNSRKDLKIYKIPSISDSTGQVMTAEIIRFTLSDQEEFPPAEGNYEFDIEAMVSKGDHLYLFSKSRGKPFKGLVKLYKLENTPGEHVAELVDKTYLGNGKMYESWITAADLKDDHLVLLTHGKIFVFSCFENDGFFKGNVNAYDLHHFSQKESVCYDNNGQRLFITDELLQGILGGKLYSYPTGGILRECK